MIIETSGKTEEFDRIVDNQVLKIEISNSVYFLLIILILLVPCILTLAGIVCWLYIRRNRSLAKIRCEIEEIEKIRKRIQV